MVTPVEIVGLAHLSTTSLIAIACALKRQATGYRDVVSLLEDAGVKLERIQWSLETLKDLVGLNGMQSAFFETVLKDIDAVKSDLSTVQDAFTDKSKLASILTSQSMLQELNRINARLHTIDSLLIQVGMFSEILISRFGKRETHMAEWTSAMGRTITPQFDSRAFQSLRAELERTPSGNEEDLPSFRSPVLDLLAFDESVSDFCFHFGKSKFKENNFDQAGRYLLAAYSNGKWEAAYYLGKMYYNGHGMAKSFEKAFQFYQIGAGNEDIPSTFEVGWCAANGHGTKLDNIGALYYFKKAAEAGYAEAMSVLGWHLLHGSDTERNWPKAYRLLEGARCAGDPAAERHLALCYEAGLVVDRNPKTAFELLLNAFEAGVVWTNVELAIYYEEGFGTPQDLTKAAKIYQRIYERRTWDGKVKQGHYGMCLIRGRGVRQDIHTGLKIVRDSLDDGRSTGWKLYGDCFRHGYGVTKDLQKAVSCYTKASRAPLGRIDRTKAHFALAEMYDASEGLPLNPRKSAYHYKYAADTLHATAQWKIGLALEAGDGIKEQKYQAFHYFHLSARNGKVEAQKKASEYYMKGMGVQRDRSNAISLLEQAAESGDREAKRMLRKIRCKFLLRIPRRISW